MKTFKYLKNQYEIFVIESKNASKNRNQGVKKAKGEILAFIDDDCIINKDLLKNAENLFKQYPEISAAGGPQLTPEDDSFFGKSVGLVMQTFLSSSFMAKRYKKSKLKSTKQTQSSCK